MPPEASLTRAEVAEREAFAGLSAPENVSMAGMNSNDEIDSCFTVVMPVYNESASVAEVVRAVLSQRPVQQLVSGSCYCATFWGRRGSSRKRRKRRFSRLSRLRRGNSDWIAPQIHTQVKNTHHQQDERRGPHQYNRKYLS